MFVRQLPPDQSREPYECNSSDEQAAIGDLRLAINAEVAPAIIELPLPRLNELLQGIIEGLRVAVSKRQERIPVRVDSTFQYDLPASQGRVEHSPLVWSREKHVAHALDGQEVILVLEAGIMRRGKKAGEGVKGLGLTPRLLQIV